MTPEVKQGTTAAIAWWAYLHSANRNASQVQGNFPTTLIFVLEKL